MMREMGRISSSSWNWMILAAITALAIVLRLWQIHESLWVDELHTSWCLQAGFDQVAQRAALGNQSPLYFWFLWGVTRLCGEGEFTLRLPSFLAGIALPGMTWLLVRRLGLDAKAEVAAILAALLISVDHTSIFYATEARPYALVELLGSVSLYLAMEAIRGGSISRIALVAALATLFYLHYTTALYIAALLTCFFAYSVIDQRGQAGRWKTWLAMGGATLVLGLPATFQLLNIASRRGNWSFFVDGYTGAEVYIALVVLLALWPRLPPVGMLLGAAVCLAPALLAWGLTWWDLVPLFHTRYIVATTPVLWASIAAAGQVADHPRVRQVASVAIAAAAIWWSGIVENCLTHGKPLLDRQESWRSAIAAANIEHQQHPQWKILVHSGLIETDALRDHPTAALREYGLLPVRALYKLNAADNDLIPLPMTQPEQLTAETREAVLRAGGAIVLLRQSADQAEAIAKELDSFGIIKRQSFGGVQVIAFEVSIEP
jgi:mannosyltransferase